MRGSINQALATSVSPAPQHRKRGRGSSASASATIAVAAAERSGVLMSGRGELEPATTGAGASTPSAVSTAWIRPHALSAVDSLGSNGSPGRR